MESTWIKFIRPPRLNYSQFDLGPEHVQLQHALMNRIELSVPNRQGHRLVASYLQTVPRSPYTIIYCHGFNGCRVEGIRYAQIAGQYGMNFCSFDFQACGQSEGEYITFGHREKDDITSVIEYLRQHFQVEQFILWGRSLGATTIQLERQQYVNAYVLDSGFNDLNKLAVRMIQRQISMPKFLIKSLMYLVKNQIEERAHFQFDDIKIRADSTMPSLYICSEGDTLIKAKNSLELYEQHKGQKKLIKIEGEHNEARSVELLHEVMQWCWQLFVQEGRTHRQSHRYTNKDDLYKKYSYLVGRTSITQSLQSVQDVISKYDSTRQRESQYVDTLPTKENRVPFMRESRYESHYQQPRYQQQSYIQPPNCQPQHSRSGSRAPPLSTKNLRNQISHQLKVSRQPIFY